MIVTVKELKETLAYADDDKIISVERTCRERMRKSDRHLEPTGDTEDSTDSVFFTIFTD